MRHFTRLTFFVLAALCGRAHAQGVQPSLSVPGCPAVASTPGTPLWQPCYPYLYTPPLVTQVTTGGTPVTAYNTNGMIKGGWLYNPTSATTNLCVAIGATAGSTTGGATSCFPPGYTFQIGPTTLPVSVNSTDSAHGFSGAAN